MPVGVKLDVGGESWRTLLRAAAGEEHDLKSLQHALLDEAWEKSTKKARKDACWRALMAAREMDTAEATTLLAAFFAHDPDRTLPKIAACRPVSVAVAENEPTALKRPNYGGGFVKGRVIWLIDDQDEPYDLSWIKVHGCPPEKVKAKERISRVCRVAVNDQVLTFRRRVSLPAQCGICGGPMNHAGPLLHVDHVTPFDVLCQEWVELHGGGEDIFNKIENPVNGPPRFTDHGLETDWSSFHRARSELRLVHYGCNLARKKTN